MEKRRLFLISSGVVLLGLLSLIVDSQVLELTTRLRHPLIENVLLIFTRFRVELLMGVIFFGIFLLASYKKETTKLVILLFIILFGSAFLAIGLQHAFAIPRPDPKIVEVHLDLWRYSFPSGHAAVVFSAVPIFSMVLPKFSKLFFAFAFLVGLSRIYMGAHYPSDVIFGSLLGYLLSKTIINWRYLIKEREVRRQLFHAILGVLFVFLIQFGFLETLGTTTPFDTLWFLPPLSRPFLFILIIGSVLILVARKHEIPIIHWFLESFERPGMIDEFPGKGPLFYFLGGFLVSLFFERNIVAASLFILAIGDSSSHLVGSYLGKVKHPFNEEKNIEGNLTGGFLGAVGASLIVHPVAAVTAAFISMFLEGLSFKEPYDKLVEDNLMVPLISALIIFFIMYLMG